VFLTEAEVLTGTQRDKMFGTHLVLTSADDTGSTTGKATSVAYPTDAFVRVSVRAQHYNVWGQGSHFACCVACAAAGCGANPLLNPAFPPKCACLALQLEYTLREAACPTCPPVDVTSSTPTATFKGLKPGTTVSRPVAVLQLLLFLRGCCCDAPHTGMAFNNCVHNSALPDRYEIDLAICILCVLQYNVTVAGIVQSGQKRQGLNSLQLTTTLDMGLRMLDITATSSTTATARAAPGAGAKFVAYIFSVRRADCPACKPLTFRSGPDGKIDISGLEPGVKVSAEMAVWNRWPFFLQAAVWTSCSANKSCRCHRSSPILPVTRPRIAGCLAPVPILFSGPETLALLPCAVPCLPSLQYEVTVTGVTASGLQTPGSNKLYLTLPLGLKLTNAKATGATTATATATSIPADAFTKVCGWLDGWLAGQAGRQAVCMP
jgi:hypothetical protein